MKTLNLPQGSDAWHEHRRTKFNASDAPAMLGESPHCTRAELMHRMSTGIVPDVDGATQRRFDSGHRVEALLRERAEQIIGEPLHPFVGIADFDERYSASFDGCTFVGDEVDECKLLNARLRAAFADMETIAPEHRERSAAKCLPIDYRIQMEQQARIAGAARVLFLTGELRDDDTLGDVFSCWYYPDDALWARIQSGWTQFEADLCAYVPPAAAAPAPVGHAPESLPALRIEVTGMVTASNLDAFKSHALAVFGGINRDLKTDSDFANAEKTVKWCADVEDRLKAAKQHALSQTATIDELFRTVDEIGAEARRVRLDLDKLVKARKEAIRGEIVAGALFDFRNHLQALDERIGKSYMPAVPADFAGVVKGLRTVQSLRDAVGTELARAKIAANEIADRIALNLLFLDGFERDRALFPDVASLCLKANDDFRAVVTSRVSEHRAAEERRAAELAERERAKIRQEEQERADREARERLELAQRAAAAEARAAATPAPTVAPVQTPAAAPIAPPAVSSQAAKVVPMQRPTPAPASPPSLKLGEIGSRLGFNVTADFLKALGFEPAARDRSALLFHESQFVPICEAIVAHINEVAEQQQAA